ncbi:MAG: hypothetical protein D6766_07435, partial [Verrucomicrobia bacterium]
MKRVLCLAGPLLLAVAGLTEGLSARAEQTPHATVDVDLTRRRAIGGHSVFDRHTWFGVYLSPGFGTTLVTIDGQRKNVDTWIRDEGAMLPSRGTVGFRKYWKNGGYVLFTEDPNRPGFINPAELARYVGTPDRYVRAKQLDPNHKTILSGEGHGEFPDFMCWPKELTHGVNTVSNHAAHAEAVIATFRRIEQAGGLMPKWYEVLNESTVQSNFGWHWDPDAWDKLAEFHNAVAEAMAVAHPEVKVAGPTDAWPYVDGENGQFSAWFSQNKRFIQLSGDKLGAYSFHPYELDFAAKYGKATVYEAQFVTQHVWSKGRLESFVDLWENEHWLRWGDYKPFVISEYGALDWGETNQFNYVKSCNAMLAALMERPDVIDKMSVFILSYAPWNPSYRLTFFTSDDGGRTYHPTPFMNYLRFWKDLAGEYLFASSDNYHVLSRAFLTNDVVYVLLHNNHRDEQRAEVRLSLPPDTEVQQAELKMLFQNHQDLGFQDYAPVASLADIPLPPEATAILRLKLNHAPALPLYFEDNYYGNKVLENITANALEEFAINVTKPLDHALEGGRLHFSLHKNGGFAYNPVEIRINGFRLRNLPDIRHSAG